MKLRFLPLILFAFFLLPEPVLCQITTAPGYIISASGDTVQAQLEYVNTNSSKKRAFTSAGSKNVAFLTPEKVQVFKINPEISFRTLPFNGKKVFMQVISEGDLNLYNYKNDLFLKTKTDSLIMLTGGKKMVEKNGTKYAIYDYTYKSQLRKYLNTAAFDGNLNSLSFDKEQISKLVLTINGQQPYIKTKPILKNKHQFEAKAGFSIQNVTLKNIPYTQDTLNSNEDFFGAMSNDPLPAEKHVLNSMVLGLSYKYNIGAKSSYLKAGMVYNKAIKTQETQTRNLYKGFIISSTGDFPNDTIGKAADTYTYRLNSLDIPVSYYAELSNGKIRPFLDFGLTTRIFSGASVTLKREIYNQTQLLRTETGKMSLPGFIVLPTFGFGCRYLLSSENSLLTGINLDTYLNSKTDANFQKSTSLSFYVGYGF